MLLKRRSKLTMSLYIRGLKGSSLLYFYAIASRGGEISRMQNKSRLLGQAFLQCHGLDPNVEFSTLRSISSAGSRQLLSGQQAEFGILSVPNLYKRQEVCNL